MSYQEKLEKTKELLLDEERSCRMGVIQHFHELFDVLPQLKTRALFEKSMDDEETKTGGSDGFGIGPDPEDVNRELDEAAQEEHEEGEPDEKDLEESDESGKEEDDI